MRRHGYFVSPSKEGVRRRLFPSPPKSRTFLPTTSPSIITSSGGCVSKQAIITFCCFAVTILLVVHLYLFQVVIRNQNNHQNQNADQMGVVGGFIQQQEQQLQLQQHPVSPETRQLQQQQQQQEKPQHPGAEAPPAVMFQTRVLEPLRPIDLEQYTIRINTWKRPEQLLVSVAHHASCPGVAQIQIVWCDPDEEPPAELLSSNYTNVVVIEKHDVNTLNERFHILTPDTPTLGILSIDDDVLRPCEAIDDGFFKWTRSPDRMVGFDGRLHVEHEDGTWQYGYLSTTEKANKYSMSLTRYCFIHRDYMDMYMNDLPATILDTVAKNLNCEDIAMSFMISSMTKGKPSLLADVWAIKSMVKLYVEEKISGGSNHKSLRDECVNNFAEMFGLKEGGKNRLKPAQYMHKKETLFSGGDVPETVNQYPKTAREVDLDSMLQRWRDKGGDTATHELRYLMSQAGFRAYKQGLMEKSDPWRKRFGK